MTTIAEPAVLDVTAHHGDIPGIEEHIVPWIFRPETHAEQARLSLAWRSNRDLLHERARWPHERLMNWKLARLGELVDYAYRHVPLYREKYAAAGYQPGALRDWSDWHSLPPVSRDEIVTGFPHRSTAQTFDLGACRRLTSSGSSGTPVQLVLEPLRADMDQLHRFRMFEQMAGRALPSDRWVYNINHAHWWITSQCGDYPTFTVSQRAPVHALAEHIRMLRPAFVSGISSAIDKLAQHGVDLASCGVLAVSTNSETTAPGSRAAWSATLGVPVLDEYSSEEAGLLSYECPQRRVHLIEDDSHLDVVDANPDGVGEVLTTDLWNRVMPIIRYRQGDLAARPEHRECECGVGFRAMDALEGRRDEAFISPVRGLISPGVLLELTENHLDYDDGLAEYRVTQLGERDIELLLVPRAGHRIGDEVVPRFTAALEREFGTTLNLTAKIVDALDVSERKKRRVLINMMGSG